MSDMLEQAIIDASALREAAIKNAESLVLEKFSGQIKDAVSVLLEQEQDEMPEMPELPGLGGPEAAPAPGAPASGQMGMSGPSDEMTVEEESSVMQHIPLAATQKGSADSISIPLDQLMEEIEKINEQMEEQTEYDFTESDMHGLLKEEDLDEEELEEGHHEKDLEEGLDEEELEEGLDEEELEEGLDEEELEEVLYNEIAEALTVEMGNNRTGWAGMPKKLLELSEEELLALEQDSEIREQRAAMRASVRELENVKESLENKNGELTTSLKEAKDIIFKLRDATILLKEKLDSANLSNAKLIYTNKALNSDSLNERQKNKLVEAISNADNVEEARVIYETLQSTVGSTSRKTQPKSLGEAIERPSSMILSARARRSDRQKANPVYNRWRSLAGIEKDKITKQ
jgi:hypothetical protein